MGKFCAKCGSEMEKDATFCANCGTSADGKAEAKVVESSSNGETRNGMATAGFILSFFVPVLGLIFSIVGLNKANQLGGNGRGLAKAGLILSIIWMVLSVIAYIIYYMVVIAAAVGSSYYY